MVNDFHFEWLLEPVAKDDTWARSGEDLLGWLRRSTLPRAQEARRFLNFDLSKLPGTWREFLCCTHDKVDIHHVFPEKWCKLAEIDPTHITLKKTCLCPVSRLQFQHIAAR